MRKRWARAVWRQRFWPPPCGPSRPLAGCAPAPLLALVGVFVSRLAISRPVIGALSAAQMAAALRHEEAHLVSHDNLKRLLMLLAPGLLPGFHGFDAIERGWARFTEWAA